MGADEQGKAEPFERAKLPMILAAVGVTGGLALAGSVERTAGGAIVLAAWVLWVAALHWLGRAGSVDARVPDATTEGRRRAGADDAGRVVERGRDAKPAPEPKGAAEVSARDRPGDDTDA